MLWWCVCVRREYVDIYAFVLGGRGRRVSEYEFGVNYDTEIRTDTHTQKPPTDATLNPIPAAEYSAHAGGVIETDALQLKPNKPFSAVTIRHTQTHTHNTHHLYMYMNICVHERQTRTYVMLDYCLSYKWSVLR